MNLIKLALQATGVILAIILAYIIVNTVLTTFGSFL
jgi:hypothetical protein